MKSIFTIILLSLAGIFCLSSCSNKDAKTNSYILVPSTDSVSKGSTMFITFGVDSFNLTDLVVSGTPVEYLYASDTFNVNDSFWMGRILVTDYQLKQISLNLSVSNTTNSYYTDTGYYYVTANNSTLTDYSKGENKTYTILAGSYIHITRSYSPVTGTMNLNLYYNHTTGTATGNFRIFR
jgi:hypothetical protein